MAELWLVCEGEPGSVDVAVLQSVFSKVLAAEIVVEPACGGNPSAVARFLELRRGGRAAFLKDRDYRPRAEAESAMSDGRRMFFWRRHSIENYLVLPTIIFRAFQRIAGRMVEQLGGRRPAWVSALPASAEQVGEWLREAGRRRVAEEACRLANHRLWADLPTTVGQVQRRDPPRPADAGPVGPNEWREALCREALRVSAAAEQTAAATQFRRENAASLYDAAYAELGSDLYFGGMEFLIDFHGRELMKEVVQVIRSNRIRLSYVPLVAALVPAAVEAYEANRTIYGQDDFRDLANGVRALAGLAALP